MTRRQGIRLVVGAVFLIAVSGGWWAFRQMASVAHLEDETVRLQQELSWEQASSRAKDAHVARITQVLNEVDERVEGMERGKLEVSFVLRGDIEQRKQLGAETLISRLQGIEEDARVNEEQIQYLQSLLRLAGGNLTQLEAMASRLRARNAELEIEAARQLARTRELSRQVEALEVKVEALETDVAERERQVTEQASVILSQQGELEQQRDELQEEARRRREVYWAVGTRRALIESGIVREERRMLGMRRRRSLNLGAESLNDHFEVGDREALEEIHTGVAWRKAELLPLRPPESFELRPEEGVIEIVDPQIFWSTSPYLVVVVLRGARD